MILPANCWKPMVAAVAVFAAAVVLTPPEVTEEPSGGCPELPISPSTSEFQNTPIVIVTAAGEMVYHGEAVATLAALDTVLANRVRGPVPEKWKDTVIVHAHASSDASRVLSISTHLEQQGYKPLFAMQRGD